MSRLTLAFILLFSSIGLGIIFILIAPKNWGLLIKAPIGLFISMVSFWLSSVIDVNIRYQKRKLSQLKEKLKIKNSFKLKDSDNSNLN